jgi:hypothetical protein
MKNGGNLERNLLDIQCGRELDAPFISRIDRGWYSSEIKQWCNQVKRLYERELPKYAGNRTVNNQDLRTKYLNSVISKEAFKSLIYKRNKDSKKKYEIAQIIQTFISCFTEIVYRYEDECKYLSYNHIIGIKKPYIKELNKLGDHINLCFLNLSKEYNCKPLSLSLFIN